MHILFNWTFSKSDRVSKKVKQRDRREAEKAGMQGTLIPCRWGRRIKTGGFGL